MAEFTHLQVNATSSTSTDTSNGDGLTTSTDDNVFHSNNATMVNHNQQLSPGILGFSNYTVTLPTGSDQDGALVQSNTDGDLVTLVRQQVEYYFSKDNISSDKYLLSQMDGDHYVPIAILASFNQVKKLTSDNELIISAIKASNVLQINPTMTKVRAIPEKRCILILREIPKETPKEDIQKLFASDNCPKFINCEFAENDCWYVTFSNEEDAQEAHRYLREEVKQFQGNPIRARIKNMAAQRATTVPKPRPQFPYPMGIQPMPFFPQQSPSVAGWPYFDPRFPFINGIPPQQHPFNTAGSQGGASGSGSGRNYSVGSAIDRREGGYNEVGGVRRGSTGGTGGRRYDGNDKRVVGGGYRYKRDDERIRNLPNRLRNKRNEELNPMQVDNTDNTRKDFVSKDRLTKPQQQKPINRYHQQKLDFAPGNFPPLPTTSQDVIPQTTPTVIPITTEEGNPKLADIVKGKKQLSGEKETAPTNDTNNEDNDSNDVTVVTTSSAPQPTTTQSKITKPIDVKTVPSNSNNKDKTKSHRHEGQPPRPIVVNAKSGVNTSRTKTKESKKPSITSNNNNNTTTTTANVQPVKQTASVKVTVNNTNTTKQPNTTTTVTNIQQSDPVGNSSNAELSPPTSSSRRSYAQMAQQKPKPSPLKATKSPNSPPPQSGGVPPTNETQTTSLPSSPTSLSPPTTSNS